MQYLESLTDRTPLFSADVAAGAVANAFAQRPGSCAFPVTDAEGNKPQEQGRAPMEVNIKHVGQTKFEIHARQHVIQSDQPVENGGNDATILRRKLADQPAGKTESASRDWPRSLGAGEFIPVQGGPCKWMLW